jgi:NMD protein affecting ribosome stability and mRNA decay
MAKYVGQCKNCGSDQHPKGNIFRIMDAWYFAAGYPDKEVPSTDKVKVCNNCDTAHTFRNRVSARQRKLQETADRLLSEDAA